MAWKNLAEDVAEEFASYDRAFEMEEALEIWGQKRGEMKAEGLKTWRLKNKPKVQQYEKVRAKDPSRRAATKASHRRFMANPENRVRKRAADLARYHAKKARRST